MSGSSEGHARTKAEDIASRSSRVMDCEEKKLVRRDQGHISNPGVADSFLCYQ